MSPRLPYSGKRIGIYGSISIRLTEHLSLYSVNNSSESNNLHRFRGNAVNELGRESALHSAQGETGNPRLRGICRQGAFQHKHPKTDNSRWTLTTGAVGAPPAGLTLTGVWSNAATMDTFICTVGCRREKSIKWGTLAREKPPNNTAVSHPGLKYHLKTTCTLDNFLQSMPQPSCSLRWNQTIPLPILIAPNSFIFAI